MPHLCCFTGFPLAVAEQGYCLVVVRRLLVAMASLVGAQVLGHVRFPGVSAHGLSSCALGSRAQAQQLTVYGLSCFTACGIFPDPGD